MAAAGTGRRERRPRISLSLSWRVFSANAAILVVGTFVLAFAPWPLHQHTALVDLVALLCGLIMMLVVNGALVRRLLRPVEHLSERMATADVLLGSRSVPAVGAGEIGTLESAFNAMMERLEAERREAGARALEAREEERARIARGLHDEIGQSMTAVLLHLKGLAGDATEEQRAKLADAQEVVKRSLEDVRRLAQELRPEALEYLGLEPAISHLASDFERRAQVRVERRIARDLPRLDRGAELAIYRIAQESLTNVARHAQATEVLVSLQRGVDGVVLRVVDDGRGLGSSQAEGGGLRGIRERALIAGGAVAITSRPSGGVAVQLKVPVGTL